MLVSCLFVNHLLLSLLVSKSVIFKVECEAKSGSSLIERVCDLVSAHDFIAVSERER